MDAVIQSTVSIDWTRGELRPAPRQNQPHRQETFYPVICSTCETVRWLRRVDAIKARECGTCQRRAAGKLGYKATTAKYGVHVATRHIRDYRLANPSSYEQIVIDQLAQLGLQDVYEREFWLEDGDGGVYLVDFVICTAGNVFAVEVGADYWHCGREDRDAAKAETLAYNSIDLLVLCDDDVLSGASLYRLAAFLGVGEAEVAR